MLTQENRKQFKQEIENILLTNESNYIFYNIYEEIGVHIVLKHNKWDVYLDINVSMKNVRHYFKENEHIEGAAYLDFEELKISLDIINWWYK